jgi:hypothetical protein
MKDSSDHRLMADARSWELYSVAIIGFIVFAQVMQWPMFPFFIDIYYHLSVMKGFAAAGGYVTHAFWEYAPFGRPHLYPPLFHLFLLMLYKLGLSVINVARSANFLMPIIMLSSIWFVARRLLNKRIAFFALLIASSVYSFYLATITTIPAMLAMISGLFGYYFVERHRPVAASACMVFCFYLHLVMPWVMGAALLLYGMLERQKRKECFIAVAAGVVAAIPLLYHQLRNLPFLSTHTVAQDLCLEINLLLCLFAIIGIICVLRQKGRYRYFTALFIISIPFAWMHPYRYFGGEGVFALIFLAALGIESVFGYLQKNFYRFIFTGIAVVLFFMVSPTLMIDRGAPKIIPVNSTFSNSVFGDSYYTHSFLRSVYNEKRYGQIVSVVNKNSSEDEILFSNNAFFVGIVGSITGRATSTGMFQEVKPLVVFDRIAAARLIIWPRDSEDLTREPVEMIEKYKLEKIADTELAFIYRNSDAVARRHVPPPYVPEMICYALIGITILLGVVLK